MKFGTQRLLTLLMATYGCILVANLLYLASVTQLGTPTLESRQSMEGDAQNHKPIRRESKSKKMVSRNMQMTALISTYEQTICLKRMIQHLRSCPVIGAIHVNWFEATEPPPDEIEPTDSIQDDEWFTPVVYDRLPDKISYRFFPRDFPTEAVFSVDVDTYFSCDGLVLAFDTWRLHDNAVVGFHPRHLTSRGYDWWESFKAPFVRNTIFVTKGAILHKDVFHDYFDSDFDELRTQIDHYITGEDMLMSFVLASKRDSELFTVCLETSDHCNVECKENQVQSLHFRTSRSRSIVLSKLYDHFGDILKSEQGDGRLVWQSTRDTSYCRSNNDLKEAKPPCKFCEMNEVCPSSTYGRSRA